jgi:hypothetical protein
MKIRFVAALTAAALCACGGTTGDSGVVAFACPSAPMLATLTSSSPALTSYTLRPLAPGEDFPFTLTVTNQGQTDATQLEDLTAATDALSYAGGPWPGSGGTCGTTLAGGASCTLSLVAHGTTAGRHTQLIALHYYDGELPADLGREVAFDVTATPFTPAARSALPLMALSTDGLIQKVNLVTVTFADSTNDDEVNTLGDYLVGSQWYQTVAKDYGLSAGTHQHVRLSRNSPDVVYGGDDAVNIVKSEHLPWHGDGQDLYMFFFTPRTGYPAMYAGAGGWHSTAMNGTVRLPYAIIKPSCAGSAPTAFVAAHELIEATTDSGQGERLNFIQSEVADLCDGHFVADGYVLPTIWSVSAAAAGGDPCVPSLGDPFFNVSVTPVGPQMVAPGSALTFTLTGWSTQPVGDWRVGGDDQPLVDIEGAPPGSFTLAFPDDLVNNGRQVPLTVTAAPNAPKGATAKIAVVSRDKQGGAKGRVQLITVTVGGNQ